MSDESQRSQALASARPLRELTRLGVDEWIVRRMWDGIQRRSTVLAGAERRWSGAGRSPNAGLGFVLALLVAAPWLGQSWLGLHGDAAVSGSPSATGPLLLQGGQHFDQLEAAPQGASQRVSFADGSSIEAAPGARVEGLAASN